MAPGNHHDRDHDRDRDRDDEQSGGESRRAQNRETLARFAEYQRTGDRRLRDALVEDHVRLAEYLARRYANRGEPLDDIRQVALVGLFKAVERFQPDRGLQFSSFAMPTIEGEIKRHFRDKGWAVRVPRRVQEVYLEMDRTVAILSQELGRAPTPDEIARRAGVSVEAVLEGIEAGGFYRPVSMHALRGDDTARGPEDLLGADDAEIAAVDDRLAVEDLLALLEPREQRIVYLRFFEGLTQSEIAAQVGISQMHVSRMLARSLEMLAEHAHAVAET